LDTLKGNEGLFDREDAANIEKLSDGKIREANLLKHWLSLLDIELSPTCNLHSEIVEELSDGLILYEIIQRLEGVILNGIESRPRTMAQAKHNLHVCLQFLKKKKLPLQYSACEDDIAQGNGDRVRGLLLAIRRLYKARSSSIGKMNKSMLKTLNQSLIPYK